MMTVLWWVTCLVCCSWVVAQTRSIAVLSYSDNNIEDFVDAVFSVNKAFCDRHNMRWISLSPSSTESSSSGWVQPLGQESDPRWEKVNCLLFLTTNNDVVYKNVDYFVWLDADMMIINFRDNFIAHWIDAFPTHDILISSEYHSETGIANTGSMILKNSEWSRNFLRRWWDEDHRRGHDQILFNVLYQSLATTATALQDLQSHIKLLPIRALNSLPPAYLTFSRDDSVLHLMGERGDYRRAVFRAAEAAIYRRLTENEGKMDFHVVDVGIDRVLLSEQLLTIMEHRIPVLLAAMMASLPPPSSSNSSSLRFDPSPILQLSEATQEYRELSLQYGQLLSTRASGLTAVSKRMTWLEVAIRSWQAWYDAFLTFYPHLIVRDNSTSSSSNNSRSNLSRTHQSLWIDVLNTLSLLENDWLTEVGTTDVESMTSTASSISSSTTTTTNAIDWERLEQTYAKVTDQLLHLVAWVQPGVSQRQVWSMIVTLWQNQALGYAQRAIRIADRREMMMLMSTTMSSSSSPSMSGQVEATGTEVSPSSSSSFAVAIDILHRILDVYTRYLVGPLHGEDRWQVTTWVEEHNSYRYRLARVYQQLGDVYCARKDMAVVGVGAVEEINLDDEVAQASDAYEEAVRLWEDLLHLSSSSSSSSSFSESSATMHTHTRANGDWQWQEDHHEYLQALQHALQCMQPVRREPMADDASHHHQSEHQRQRQRLRHQFFLQKLLVLQSLFPTVPIIAPTSVAHQARTKTPSPPTAYQPDSTPLDAQSTTLLSTHPPTPPPQQQQKRRFRKKRSTVSPA